MTKYEILLNDAIAEFKSCVDFTMNDSSIDTDIKRRVISRHYSHAEGMMDGIRKAFLKIGEESIDFYFDCFDAAWNELNEAYEQMIDMINR